MTGPHNPQIEHRTRRSAALGARFLLPLLVLLPGCSARADLVPGPPSGPPAAFQSCPTTAGERLTIQISNWGGRVSKSTTTRVLFGQLPAVNLPTRPVLPGDTVSVFYRIPEACYDPDCEITVMVDSLNEVAESREENNEAKKVCGGDSP